MHSHKNQRKALGIDNNSLLTSFSMLVDNPYTAIHSWLLRGHANYRMSHVSRVTCSVTGLCGLYHVIASACKQKRSEFQNKDLRANGFLTLIRCKVMQVGAYFLQIRYLLITKHYLAMVWHVSWNKKIVKSYSSCPYPVSIHCCRIP